MPNFEKGVSISDSEIHTTRLQEEEPHNVDIPEENF
jgi:hypothetical protein